MTRYYFPLTNKDISHLRQGKLVSKNFDTMKGLMHVVAWNKTKLGKLDKTQFRNVRKAGIDVANIPLEEKDIQKIEDHNGFSVYYSQFEILIVSRDTLRMLKAERG